ncbi:hypothetical protein HUU39_06155 [candidate division KSB1 bacterium]|nr:LuxR C-terminal-related transcriptional regulator [bacterium]NUM64843.1 hypothetical protein [candidate division KSB1 bacterium]
MKSVRIRVHPWPSHSVIVGPFAVLVAILEGRELEVLRLLARGDNSKTIALHPKIFAKTVDTHRRNLMR